MPTPKSSWVWVDLSPDPSAANTAALVVKPVPVKGTIRQVNVAINENLATGGGIVALSKGATNILSAASLNLEADLGDLIAETAVLTTAQASLKVTTADCLKAAYTLTTFAITNAIGVLVGIEPDEW